MRNAYDDHYIFSQSSADLFLPMAFRSYCFCKINCVLTLEVSFVSYLPDSRLALI
jgi:hypothetical protein